VRFSQRSLLRRQYLQTGRHLLLVDGHVDGHRDLDVHLDDGSLQGMRRSGKPVLPGEYLQLWLLCLALHHELRWRPDLYRRRHYLRHLLGRLHHSRPLQ
jgi:hypothetical protein